MRLVAGFGASYYRYNYRVFNRPIHGRYYRFMAPNFRAGLRSSLPLTSKLALTTGIDVGFRLKRGTIYPDPRQGGVIGPFTFIDLDRDSNIPNYFILEIPIAFEYNLTNELNLALGCLYRRFLQYAEPDYAGSLGASYKMNEKFSIGIQYAAALNYTFKGDYYVHNDFGQDIGYRVKNRLVQTTVTYRLH